MGSGLGEGLSDLLLGSLVSADGEHEATTAGAAHLGAKGTSGASSIDEVVELLAADSELLADSVVAVSKCGKGLDKVITTLGDGLLSLVKDLHVLLLEGLVPGHVSLTLGAHITDNLSGGRSNTGASVHNGDLDGELLLVEEGLVVSALEAEDTAEGGGSVVDTCGIFISAVLLKVSMSVSMF